MGDYQTCVDFVECMLDNDDYPNPNSVCFCTALSALVHLNKVYEPEVDVQNEIVEKVLDLMEKANVRKNDNVYRILMQISAQHGDLEKVHANYKELRRKNYRIVKVMTAYSFSCFRRMEYTEADVAAFKEWVVG